MLLRTCLKIPMDGVAKVLKRNFYVPVYMPRRALLYVPSDDDKKLNKILGLDVDCIAMDCEDGVASNKKTQARLNIRNFLDKGKPTKSRTYDLAVRVNAADSGLLQQDLSVIVTGKHLPDSILLPKVDNIDNLRAFADLLDQYISSKNADFKIQLILGVESALSLINLNSICVEALKIARQAKFYPVALLFGSDDFCASIGATRSDDGLEVLYARQKIVVVAKAFDLQAIDMVHIKIHDLEGLQDIAEKGARLGFTGKQIIHPGQVEITQKAFLPTDQQVTWAQALIQAFHNHQQGGKGVFVFEGNMIDMPTMRQAQNIVDLMNAIMIRQ